MEIIIKGADFSNLGLGNVRWVENYITLTGITDTTKKTALRALFTKYIASGFDSKFEVFRLFITGTASNDALNIINPVYGSAYSLIFKNDAPDKHTTSGYAPLTSTAYAKSGYEIKDLTNFHLHCYNNGTGSFVLGRVANSSIASDYPSGIGTSNYNVSIFCNGNSSYFSCNQQNATITSGALSVQGLYSVYKNNSAVVARKDNAYIGALTSTSVTIDPTIKLKMLEGTAGVSSSGAHYPSTNGKSFFIGYGATAWTDADETNLNTMINDFKTAMGI